jgi:predicted ester cyclase
MQTEERKAIARLAHEAINSKNVALLEGQPGFWQTRQIFPLLFAAYPDLSSTVEQQTVDGEWVTTRITLRGTQWGEFMGVAPTGKSFAIMQISLDQVAGGKVVEHFGVSDWFRALVAFGVVAAPAAISAGA